MFDRISIRATAALFMALAVCVTAVLAAVIFRTHVERAGAAHTVETDTATLTLFQNARAAALTETTNLAAYVIPEAMRVTNPSLPRGFTVAVFKAPAVVGKTGELVIPPTVTAPVPSAARQYASSSPASPRKVDQSRKAPSAARQVTNASRVPL